MSTPDPVRLVYLVQTAAIAANESHSANEALQRGLHEVCAHTGWPLGHAYLVSGDSPTSTKLWFVRDRGWFEFLMTAVEASGAEPGGLADRVRASGQAQWRSDISQEPAAWRRAAYEEVGIVSSAAFPVTSGSRVVGVLEFFSPTPLASDPAFGETMTMVGAQLGHAVRREEERAK